MNKKLLLSTVALLPLMISPIAIVASCSSSSDNSNGGGSDSSGGSGSGTTNGQFGEGQKPGYNESFVDDLPTKKPESVLGPETAEPKPPAADILKPEGGKVNGLEAKTNANVVKQLELLPSTRIESLSDSELTKLLGVSGAKVEILEGDTLAGTLKLKVTSPSTVVLADGVEAKANNEQIIEVSGFKPIYQDKYKYTDFKINASWWIYYLLDVVDKDGKFNADEAWKRIQFLNSEQWNKIIDDATIEVIKPNADTSTAPQKKSWKALTDHKFEVYADKIIPASGSEPAKISLKIAANAPFSAMEYKAATKTWVEKKDKNNKPIRVPNGMVLQAEQALALPLNYQRASEGVLYYTTAYEPYFADLYGSVLRSTIIEKTKQVPDFFINNMVFNDMVFGGRAKEISKKYFNGQTLAFAYDKPDTIFADDSWNVFRFGVKLVINGKIQDKIYGNKPAVVKLELFDKTKSIEKLKEELKKVTTKLELKETSVIKKNIIKLMKEDAKIKGEIDKGLSGTAINTSEVLKSSIKKILTNGLDKAPFYNVSLGKPLNKEQTKKNLELWDKEFDFKFLDQQMNIDFDLNPDQLKPEKGHLNFDTNMYNYDDKNIFTIQGIFFELYDSPQDTNDLTLQISADANSKTIKVSIKAKFDAALGNSTVGPVALPVDLSFSFTQTDWDAK